MIVELFTSYRVKSSSETLIGMTDPQTVCFKVVHEGEDSNKHQSH